MRIWENKADNTAPNSSGLLTAAEDDARGLELNNAVLSAGLSLDPTFITTDTDLSMLAQAMARYASGGKVYVDTGSVNSYVLGKTGSFVVPKGLFGLMLARWKPANTNTGACTINVNSLGSKPLRSYSNQALTAGMITAGTFVDMYYDASLEAWLLMPWSDTGWIKAQAGTLLPANAPGFLKNNGSGTLSWDAGDLLTVTNASANGNITLDGAYDVTDLTLVGAITLNAVTNMVNNRPHFVRLRQDATGSRAISINSNVFKAGQVTISASTAATQIDILGLMCRGGTIMEVIFWNKGVL